MKDRTMILENGTITGMNSSAAGVNAEVIVVNAGFIKVNAEVIMINTGFIKVNTEVITINAGFIKVNPEVITINAGFIMGIVFVLAVKEQMTNKHEQFCIQVSQQLLREKTRLAIRYLSYNRLSGRTQEEYFKGTKSIYN
jgi:F0F1-type ATP synthase epsilon subunit